MLLNWRSEWKRLGQIIGAKARSSRRRRHLHTTNCPHQVEILEERTLLSTFYVDNAADFQITNDQGAAGLDAGDTVTWDAAATHSAGPVSGLIFGIDAFVSIQHAVNAAQTSQDASDTINVAAGTFVENVTINTNVQILGTGETLIDGNRAGSVIDITGNATVILDSLIIQNGQADHGGGINHSGHLTLIETIVQNNTAAFAGGGIRTSAGTLVIQAGSVITGNSAGLEGGGIRILSGSLTLDDSVVSNNTTDEDGGGINTFSSVPLSTETTIRNGAVIRGNSAGSQGGGIYNDGQLTVEGSFIEANTAGHAGGGLFNLFSTATATIQGGSLITGNSTTGSGGGINNDSGLVIIDNSTVATNIAMDHGGGVLNIGGTARIEGGTLVSENSAKYGGGIHTSNGTLTVDNATVRANTGNDSGGAIYNYNGDAIIQGGSMITGNSAGSQGGGIFNREGLLTVNASTVGTNTSSLTGGGIHNFLGTAVIQGGSVLAGNVSASNGAAILNSNGVLRIEGGSAITGNLAVRGIGGIYSAGTLVVDSSRIEANTASAGAAIYVINGTATVSGSTITGNSAGANGAICNDGTLTIDGTIIQDNIGLGIRNHETATIQGGSLIAGHSSDFGGGIYSIGVLTIESSTIRDNSAATDGGGLYNSGTATIQGGTIITQNVAMRDGGGIANAGILTVNNSIVETNSAANLGGGIENNFGTATLTIENEARITGNRAAIGGGIFTRGVVVIDHSTVSSNTGTGSGGGLFSTTQDADVTIRGGSVFSGNFGGSQGGGLNNNSGTVTIENAVFDSNTSTNGGGGIYSFRGSLSVTTSRITGNTSAFGGGINTSDDTFTLSATLVSQNTASQLGGGIWSTSNSAAIENGSVIAENTGNDGGGIRFAGDLLTIDDSTISENTALNDGGGIHNAFSVAVSTVIIQGGSTIVGNRATRFGGGIYNHGGGILTVEDSTVDANTTAGGGALYNSGTATIQGGTIFVNNTSTGDGGGILNAASGRLTFADSAITGNTATRSGGGIQNNGSLILSGISTTLDVNTPNTLAGSGSVASSPEGTVSFATGSLSTYSAATLLTSGTTLVNGTLNTGGGPVTVQDGAILGGTGTVQRNVNVQSGGTIDPGTSPGILNVGDVHFMGGANLDVEISGLTTAGVDYDQLQVTGTVTVEATAALRLYDNLPGSNLAANGDSLILINNDGSDAIVGNFGPLFVNGVQITSGDLADGVLNNGDRFTFNGDDEWRVFYDGGDGNDLTLMSIDTSVIFVNDDFTAANGFLEGQRVQDADPNTAGDQTAIIGLNAFATVQAGINAVDAGGSVLITDDIDGPAMSSNAGTANDGPGMYVENVRINKNVTVQSTEGDAAAVIVDGNDAGSVFTIDPAFTVALDSLAIQNGYSSEGAGINNQGDLTVTASIIQNNTATSNGGGIFNSTGTATIQGGSMIASNSALAGAGIYNEAGTLTVDNSTIGGNTASTTNVASGGGGIFNNTGTATIQGGSEITANTAATTGGGIFSQGTLMVDDSTIGTNSANTGGGIRIASGTAIIQGSSLVTANTATFDGGGIFSEGTLTVDNATVSTNTSGLMGGGIRSTGSATIQNGAMITSNSAASYGGGISSEGSLTVDNSTISTNTAGSGGGISFWLGTATIRGGSMITSNSALSLGGGIFNSESMTVNGSTVANNTAANGGGIFNAPGDTLAIEAGSTIVGNTASVNGGGIFNNGGTLSASSSNILNNAASGEGGGIWNGGGEMVIDGTTITGNTAGNSDAVEFHLMMSSEPGDYIGQGRNYDYDETSGAFSISGTMASGTVHVRYNSGSSVWWDLDFAAPKGTPLTVGTYLGATRYPFQANQDPGLDISGSGRGSNRLTGMFTVHEIQYAEDGTIEIFDASFEQHSENREAALTGRVRVAFAVNGSGGGIFNSGGTVAVQNGSSITNNGAEGTFGSGGGILNSSGMVTLGTGVGISGNTAGGTGGGITNLGGTVVVEGSTLSGNTARDGGGIWNDSNLSIDSAQVMNNTARGTTLAQGGGGISNRGGNVTITGGTISNNRVSGALGSGGGILNQANGTVVVTEAAIIANTANQSGGGIESDSEAGVVGLSLINVTLNDNVAQGGGVLGSPGSGGGLHATGTGHVNISGGTINGNSAASEGGGIWNDVGVMSIDGTTIEGNTASGDATILLFSLMMSSEPGDYIGQGKTYHFDETTGTISVNRNAYPNVVTIQYRGANSNSWWHYSFAAPQGMPLAVGTYPGATRFPFQDDEDPGLAVSGDGRGSNQLTGMFTIHQIEYFEDGSIKTFDASFEQNYIDYIGGTPALSGRVRFDFSIGGGGAGLFNAGGVVEIQNTSFSDNIANGTSGSGGGIFNGTMGTMALDASMLSANYAKGDGGGIWNDGTLRLSNTTISGNSAETDGGGIFTASGDARIYNSTIARNRANVDGVGEGTGGGILHTGEGSAALYSTIVATNQAGLINSDVSGIVDGSFNLVGVDTGFTGLSNGANSNQIGTAENPIDPRLKPLAPNGGPTLTHAIIPDSPAINAGANPEMLEFDQRGAPFVRQFGSQIDIGAFELQSEAGGGNDIIATATGPGTEGIVRVTNAITQDPLFDITPYPGFLGGIRVAVGDVNNDGTEDIITSTGPGGGPHIKVISGADGFTELFSFYAYDASFLNGVYVASADLNGDGNADIITGADAGGGPHVKVFSGADGSELFSFFAFGASFHGGVRVAAGDLSGDGTPDIIAGVGAGATPHVRVFDGNTGEQIEGPLGSFFALDVAFTGGVYVAAGDVNGDDRIDLIVGAGVGGGPRIRIFDGVTGGQLAGPLGSFFAYDPGFTGGVRVAASDITGDGLADIITTPGSGIAPNLRAFDAASTGTVPDRIRDVLFADADLSGGAFVAASVEAGNATNSMDLTIAGLDQLFADGDLLEALVG